MSSDEEHNRNLTERYYNATLEEIFDLTDNMVAEEFVMYDPLSAEPIRGRDGLEAFHREFDAAFSDVRLIAHDIRGGFDVVHARGRRGRATAVVHRHDGP